MRVALVPCNEGAVEWYRLRWPAAAVEAATGWKVEIYHPRDIGVTRDGLMSGPPDVMGLDLIVTQRPDGDEQVAMLRRMQRAGIAVVIDMDDLIGKLPPSNPHRRHWNAMVGGKPRHRHAADACAVADLVTGTTDAIGSEYAPHGRWEKLPNLMPAKAFNPVPAGEGEEVTIGWSGWRASHQGDLKAVGGALRAVLDSDPHVSVRVVGDATWAAGELRVPVGRLKPVDSVSFEDYHRALVGTDIGIVPLDLTNPMNKGKSWLKVLEFMAAGAPVIASATPANRELASKTGAGFVTPVATPGEWEGALQMHIGAIRLMREDSIPVADLVQSQASLFAVDNHAALWADAWQRAVDRRRALDE